MINESVARAGAEIAKFLIQAYRNERGVHSETVIGAAAALTGEFALRAAEAVLPEKGWVFSERANRLLFGRMTGSKLDLWSIICHGAVRAGASERDLPDPVVALKRTAAAVGGSPFPALSVPTQHFPHEWSPNACPRFRTHIAKYGADHGIAGTDLAFALAIAIAMLIEQTKAVLPPVIAATIALDIMLGVTKMVPLTIPIEPSAPPAPPPAPKPRQAAAPDHSASQLVRGLRRSGN